MAPNTTVPALGILIGSTGFVYYTLKMIFLVDMIVYTLLTSEGYNELKQHLYNYIIMYRLIRSLDSLSAIIN